MDAYTRRKVLAGTGAATIIGVAGCSGQEPAHDEGDDLALTVDMVRTSTAGDWIVPEENEYNFEYEFHEMDDDTIMSVIAGSIGVYDTIDGANQAVEDALEAGQDEEEFDAGDEAYWYEGSDHTVAIFRHSNAAAELLALRRSGLQFAPATQRTVAVVRTWAEKLQDEA